ncbi:hypothetical protein IG631_15749 [Alternaria alternata]|nr:hypothetical protein IG631_15749 [Alternaria alternata]
MTTFIILTQSLSKELLSFPVSSASGSTKLFKTNMVFSASSKRVATADPLTGDVKALSFFRDQYHQCRQQHSMCQRLAPHNDFAPTRAIYVGSVGEKVYLCDGVKKIAGAAYTVLSHCWGKNPQQIKLTKLSEETLKQGIAMFCLPKTFQDAIAVTRMFQIRCIFQDDLHDWATEASRMRDIYSKSDFCIAATGAESGDVGLFFDRDVEQLTPFMVEVTWSSKGESSDLPTPGSYLGSFNRLSAIDAIDFAPLNQRAWVAQERFLSPRTMHFTRSLLFWECHTSLKSENDITPESERYSQLSLLRVSLNNLQWQEPGVESIQDIALYNTIDNTNVRKIREVYTMWNVFLTFYTSCKITKESDVLVALVGVADEVGHAVSDKLVAGLWEARFIQELCWSSDGGYNSRPSVWRAPTWSWASVSGPIISSSLKDFTKLYNMAAVVGLSVLTKPSGEVEQGSVLVKCRPVSGTIHHIGKQYYYTWGTLDRSISTSRSAGSGIRRKYARIDVQLDVPTAPYYHADQVVDVQLLVLMKLDFKLENSMKPKESLELEGIFVVNSEKHAGAFERVGYFHARREAAKLVLAAHDQAREQEILLV